MLLHSSANLIASNLYSVEYKLIFFAGMRLRCISLHACTEKGR